ncbi:protein spaetzle 4 [Eupeodes corollae]|uniref:protein spaetzle 4 n=1 Tax=Eupeodes corollae TaxID=290404 RepID=UPI00249014A6|nr:protein spaetzle 4 [Eupeodes corollae]
MEKVFIISVRECFMKILAQSKEYIQMRHVNMDRGFKFANKFRGHFLFLLLFAITVHRSVAFGFDSANSCSPNKMSRRGRAQLVATIPCDLSRQAYCHLPGAAYPWHAVRRFVHENQGLMKRMYGDVKHISILRTEIQNNDIDVEDLELAAARYSRDGFRRTKVMHNQFESNRNNDVVKEPHFRPVSSSSSSPSTTTVELSSTVSSSTGSTTTTQIPVTTDEATTIPTEPGTTLNADLGPPTTSTTQKLEIQKLVNATTEGSKRSTSKLDDVEFLESDEEEDDNDDDDDVESLESNSVYEPTSPSAPTKGENIQIVDSPNLVLSNITATISTTLKVASPPIIKNEPTSPATMPLRSTEADKVSQTINLIANLTKLRVNGFAATTPLKATAVSSTINSSVNNLHNLYNNAPTEPTTAKLTETKKPTIVLPVVAKPVVRDGQLFQDTFQKEPLQVGNLKGINACPVKEEVVAPFWANNTRGEVLALLNLYPFEQYVHWEKCTHELKQMYCRDGCRCEQQYRLHRLLAYDPHNECRGIFSDWFRFPSCCICKCYDIPSEFRATSRSPRSEADYRHPAEIAEAEVRKAVYEHASEDWYRPKDELDLYD